MTPTTVFSAEWCLRNKHRNSILMTCHYPDLGSASAIGWSKFPQDTTNQKYYPDLGHQCRISAVILKETSGGFVQCWMCFQAREATKNLCNKYTFFICGCADYWASSTGTNFVISKHPYVICLSRMKVYKRSTCEGAWYHTATTWQPWTSSLCKSLIICTDLYSVVKNITVAIGARCPGDIYNSWGLRDNCHILWWAWDHYKKKIHACSFFFNN